MKVYCTAEKPMICSSYWIQKSIVLMSSFNIVFMMS